MLNLALLFVVGFVALLRQRRSIRDTTLGPTWWWTVFAWNCVCGCELAAPESLPFRFAAAIATFCPTISILGAKRPQDGMWNLVVVSLWGMLILPSVESLVLQRTARLEVHDLRAWFLWLLIAMTVGNRLGTRQWLGGVLWGAGQALLVVDYLPLVARDSSSPLRITALTLMAAALVWGARGLPIRQDRCDSDRAWLDFRDLFGSWWGLRIVERINSTAIMNQWPVRLTWSGFVTNGQPWHADAVADPALQQALENLLLRFTSSEWLRSRDA